MIIYRVEIFCPEKKIFVGPYKVGGKLHLYSLGMENNSNRHPSPWCDGIFNFEEYHYCGFENLNKLYQWFHDSNLRNNMKVHHVISLYDDKDRGSTEIGIKQLVFVKSKSILIGRFNFMKTLEASKKRAEKIISEYQNNI